MTNRFDSRALQRTDCYGQRFMRPGDYPYAVVPAFGAVISTDRPYTIRVRGDSPTKDMSQHHLSIGYCEGRFRMPEPLLEINVGDMVLWNCNDRCAFPYAVVGDKEFFSSTRLVNESGYSHAFGTAGEFNWVDAYGSKASGLVRVRDPACKSALDLKRWQQGLARGVLVTISDAKATPSEVEIVSGQTVFFLVTKGPGVSITDAELLTRSAAIAAREG